MSPFLAQTGVLGNSFSKTNWAVWFDSPDRITEKWILFWYMFVQAQYIYDEVCWVIQGDVGSSLLSNVETF